MDVVTLVAVTGGRDAAIARMRRGGWSPASIDVNGAQIACVAKGAAVVAFHPTDPDLASLPCAGGGFAGFVPLPPGNPLREEAIDLLCDSAPGGSMDFTKGGKR